MLLTEAAAGIIHARIGNNDLRGDIASLYHHLSEGRVNAKHVAPLLKLLLTPKRSIAPQDSDVEIWTKVLDLIERIRPLQLSQPTTPPQSHPSFTSSFQQTPWSFNSGRFADSSEHRAQVDDVLRGELLPGLLIDVPDFLDAVFGHIPRLDELAKTVFDRCQNENTRLYIEGSGWSEWPRTATEKPVLKWLQELVERFATWVIERGVHPPASRKIYGGPSIYLDGSSIKRKMDVGVMACQQTDHETTYKPNPNWAQILVVGELKSNSIEDGQESAWLDLATYAREVFRTQDRRFVLGFTLCGSMMRLWHFDRSGSSGSPSFDINLDGPEFVRVMLGFLLMNDKQLGLDPTIQQLNGQRCVEITRGAKIERLILTEEIRKHAIVAGRATVCWRAYRDEDQSKEPLVVKDSWQYEDRPEEGELIKEATDKGVKNIARYYHHETVQVDGKNDDTIENVRKGLMRTCRRTKFKQRSSNEPNASVSGPLGKSVEGRSQSQSHSLSRKRSSSTAQMAPPLNFKRSCSSFESRNPVSPTHNRVHRRIITRDSGKPIYKASSPMALITGLIGAIKGENFIMNIESIADLILGHESSLDAGILHRDVSSGNIMLTENENDGFLIDYDLAIKTTSDRASGAPSKTGTKVFMAIGALRSESHSFMHDLESFFWVLFWVCIHCQRQGKEDEVQRRIYRKYDKWNSAGTEELADLKTGLIAEEERFNQATEDFTFHFRPLTLCVLELRKCIFPDGKRWFRENRMLYFQMNSVLNRALNRAIGA